MKINTEALPKIIIKDLVIPCIIGVYHTERKEKQPVIINVVLWCEPLIVFSEDDIQKTLDYEKMCNKINKLTVEKKFYLIETLAREILSLCLDEQLVVRAKVTIEKPQALVHAASAGIEVFGEK